MKEFNRMKETTKISIVIADDHEIFRNGVQFLIDREEDMEVVGMAENGMEAIEKCILHRPDILLLDISMPKMTGLEVAKALSEDKCESKVLLLSLYDRDDYIKEALKAGVYGYVLKDSPNEVFLKAIRKAHAGDYFYSGDLTNVLVNEYINIASSENASHPKTRLSSREIEIIIHVKNGMSNKDLAEIYNISTRTIEAHRLNIMRKLGVKQFDTAIKEAEYQGFLTSKR